MAYFGANIIELFFWLFFFFLRRDLRKEMLIMSLLATPLGLFDILFVPLYWQPVTFLHLPVGIEGLIYSFLTGGIAAIIYAEVAKKVPTKIHRYHKHFAFLAILLVPVLLFTLRAFQATNVIIDLGIALLCGDAIIFYLRKDLVKSSLVGGIAFGCMYFILLNIWLTIFPEAKDWFRFVGLPRLFIFNAPLYELLFGILFASYCGNLYEFLFGYKFMKQSKRNR